MCGAVWTVGALGQVVETMDLEVSDPVPRIREHREHQGRLEVAAGEVWLRLSGRPAVLDGVEAIATCVRGMRQSLGEGELTEARPVTGLLVKETVVARYTVPMPKDPPVAGRHAGELSLGSPAPFAVTDGEHQDPWDMRVGLEFFEYLGGPAEPRGSRTLTAARDDQERLSSCPLCRLPPFCWPRFRIDGGNQAAFSERLQKVITNRPFGYRKVTQRWYSRPGLTFELRSSEPTIWTHPRDRPLNRPGSRMGQPERAIQVHDDVQGRSWCSQDDCDHGRDNGYGVIKYTV